MNCFFYFGLPGNGTVMPLGTGQSCHISAKPNVSFHFSSFIDFAFWFWTFSRLSQSLVVGLSPLTAPDLAGLPGPPSGPQGLSLSAVTTLTVTGLITLWSPLFVSSRTLKKAASTLSLAQPHAGPLQL